MRRPGLRLLLLSLALLGTLLLWPEDAGAGASSMAEIPAADTTGTEGGVATESGGQGPGTEGDPDDPLDAADSEILELVERVIGLAIVLGF
jgi:hypothetical protein